MDRIDSLILGTLEHHSFGFEHRFNWPCLIIAFAISVVEFVVGFVLGYGLISKYFLEKNEAAKEKGQQLRLKLIKYQAPGGIILIILGVLEIIF